MTSNAKGSAVHTWVYFDRELDEEVIASYRSDVEAYGCVCTRSHHSILRNSTGAIYISRSADEAIELIRLGFDVFLPGHLVESAPALLRLLTESHSRLWLADNYVSRYLMSGCLQAGDELTARVGVAGIAPGYPNSLDRYAYIWGDDVEATAVAAAVQVGVRHLWVSLSSRGSLDERMRKLAELHEIASLVALFAGQSPSELDRVWEERLCLVARHGLVAGDVIRRDDFVLKPAAGGLSAEMMDKVVGKYLRYPLQAGEVLTFSVLE